MLLNKFFIPAAALAVVVAFATNMNDKPEKPFPYSDNEVREFVVNDHGKKAVRIAPDVTLNFPELMKNRNKCFILMSKKDYYLYVYEPQGTDTVMLAKFDC